MLPDMDVSRETQDKLDIYAALLEKWQKAINLVSDSTLADAQKRHFEDSLQLLPHVPSDTGILYDLGSGGGFPGLVLAMVLPNVKVTLIESDQRKCSFLRTVSRETSTKVDIITDRIENVVEKLPAPDLISARALATVQQILDWSSIWAQKNEKIEYALLKGAQWEQEIAVAQEKYSFIYENFQSQTENAGAILKISQVMPK